MHRACLSAVTEAGKGGLAALGPAIAFAHRGSACFALPVSSSGAGSGEGPPGSRTRAILDRGICSNFHEWATCGQEEGAPFRINETGDSSRWQQLSNFFPPRT